MNKIIEAHKFFFKESKSYMKGYSNWYYYTRLPKAYFKYMYLCIKPKQRWVNLDVVTNTQLNIQV